MSGYHPLEQRLFDYLGQGWGYVERYGWYVVFVALVLATVWPYVMDILRRIRSNATDYSAQQVSDFAERQKLARERQAKMADERMKENAELDRERRARMAEERMTSAEHRAKQAGLNPRAGGRRLGTGDGDEAEASAPEPPAPKPKPKTTTSRSDDPFRRRRESYNPLMGSGGGGGGYAPSRRAPPGGGG